MEASPATRSKISLTKELRIDIALLEIPVSGCTCFKTRGRVSVLCQESEENARSDAKWKDADECLMDASVCDDYL